MKCFIISINGSRLYLLIEFIYPGQRMMPELKQTIDTSQTTIGLRALFKNYNEFVRTKREVRKYILLGVLHCCMNNSIRWSTHTSQKAVTVNNNKTIINNANDCAHHQLIIILSTTEALLSLLLDF